MNKTLIYQVIFLFLSILSISGSIAQTSTFIKTVSVSATAKVELTDASGQPLKVGGLYRVKLAVSPTGTRTGAEYLVWYDSPTTTWQIRAVALAGSISNHPLLIVEDNVVKVYTNHANGYAVKAFVEFYDTGNGTVVPQFFGSSFQWQRNGTHLFYLDGNIGVGTDVPSEKLSVKGKIRAQEIKVETANWPDYVFSKDYGLRSLDSLRLYIQENGHLPEVPNAESAESEGISLGEMNKILLKKIEELTLYLLEKDKEIVEIKRVLKKNEN
ncbi:hypothetical protein [Sphingobacterium siyangense]|uniref:hypothetical protein n=1 Tax=Sphingobacterium siyangense TaxID=459529 RepID=UPI002FDABC0D